MTSDSQTSYIGIVLPEVPTRPKGYSLEGLMRDFINSRHASRGAKDFLNSASPSRVRSCGTDSNLIAVEGSIFKKAPHTEEIKRRVPEEWSTPFFEDALRIFPLISSRAFFPGISAIIFLHEPVKGHVLGFTNENARIILTAHKVESRMKGWQFYDTLAFAFRY